MISEKYKFIYIHIPKTGGTSVQSILLPYSDDEMYTAPYQDGINSFEIRGPITPDKHASLQDYYDRLGSTVFDYRIITSIRHPVSRIISGVFSPHKWVDQGPTGEWSSRRPYWDEQLLTQLLKMPNLRPAVEFLKVNGQVQDVDFLIRAETFEADLRACVSRLGLPVPDTIAIPHKNRSAASPDLTRQALSNQKTRKLIEDFYREDMVHFGYGSFSTFDAR